jgi:hypothetical protein
MIAAPAALLLSPGRAEAILTYNIFESGSDVVVQTSGSLALPGTMSTGNCGNFGLLESSSAFLCTGNDSFDQDLYSISGPTSGHL